MKKLIQNIKEHLKRFFQNIKEHWIIALICAAVMLTAVTFAVIVTKNTGLGGDWERPVRQGYFEDTDYPVYVTERQGNVVIELNGAKTPELQWQTAFTDVTVAVPDPKAKEHSGKLKVTLEPRQTGYTVVSFTRPGKIGEVSYDAAEIHAELYATSEADGTLTLRCSNVYQTLASVGAADTETPYLLVEDRVLLPKGGDWTLTYRRPQGVAADEYYVEPGQDEQGVQMFTVYPRLSPVETRAPEDLADGDMPPDDEDAAAGADTAAEEGLVLKSASLGITVPLACLREDARSYVLCPVEAADGK